MTRIVPIVEGHGEVEAVPVLLRRLAADLGTWLDVARPIRIPKGKLVKEGELRRAVQLAGRLSAPGDAILVLLDADEDFPAQLASELRVWASSERGDRRISVVFAKREFEAWFLAAAESLVARKRLATGVTPPADPEAVSDAKGWLSRAMGRHYSETLDQPALAAEFDLVAAGRCPSFAKLRRDFVDLVGR